MEKKSEPKCMLNFWSLMNSMNIESVKNKPKKLVGNNEVTGIKNKHK